ncbi:MAG: hypothetical protein EOP04_18595 [Proteobacteria bacterium]|nr:MAG: hypothetical protein EOP04_18595 [Pseudomonadota bacterium]
MMNPFQKNLVCTLSLILGLSALSVTSVKAEDQPSLEFCLYSGRGDYNVDPNGIYFYTKTAAHEIAGKTGFPYEDGVGNGCVIDYWKNESELSARESVSCSNVGRKLFDAINSTRGFVNGVRFIRNQSYGKITVMSIELMQNTPHCPYR